MSSLTVSVLMPVYNTERYVGEAVESILNQTFTDFEFIIVDDGSTDGSLKVLREYADKDPRIRLISRENRGLGETRNELLREARGELVAWADADDVSHPHRLETQARPFRENGGVVWCHGAVRMVDSEGCPIRVFDHANTPGFTCVAMTRRQAALEAGGFRKELRICEDRDLVLRLKEIGEIVILPDVLVDYRQHPGSVCHSMSQAIMEYSALVDRLADERRETGSDRLQRGEASAVEIPIELHQPTAAWRTHRKWAWWALGAGNVATARKHAWRAVRRAPWAVENWRALYCAWRGR